MNKSKLTTWPFGIIIIVNIYYLYLIDRYNTRIYGVSMQDIALAAAVIWGLYYWIKLIKLPNPKFRFKGWMLSVFGLVLLSSVQSNLLCGQSLFNGIAPQRWVWIWAFMYFPLRKCIYYEQIDRDDFILMLLAIGVCQLVLWSTQFFLGDKILLTHVGRGMRSGRTRYYYHPILLDFLFLMSLDRFFKSSRIKKMPYAILTGWILFEVMIIQQFRATTMGLLFCLGMFCLVHVFVMEGNRKYKAISLVIGFIVVGAVLSAPLMRSALALILENRHDIRAVGRELYIQTFLKHPILGGGYPNTHYGPAMEAVTGGNKAIYLSDNGVFGFLYLYGGIGIIWLVTLWGRLLINGMRIKKYFSELSYLLLPLFFIFVSRNEIHWYWEYGFIIFSVFLCIEDSKIDEAESKGAIEESKR